MRNKTHLRMTLLLLAGIVFIALVMAGCGQQNETGPEVDEAAVDTAATAVADAVAEAGLNSEELKVLSARIDGMIDDAQEAAQEAEAEAAALAEAETETATEEAAVAETEAEATDAGDETPAEEESSEPAGVGILMLLVGLASVVIVGLVRFDRENYRSDEESAS